jgi:hypothetical protein
VALEGQFHLRRGDAAAVVGDAHHALSAVGDLNADFPRARVYAVLHQFFNDRRRPPHHLTGGDLGDDFGRKDADHASVRECKWADLQVGIGQEGIRLRLVDDGPDFGNELAEVVQASVQNFVDSPCIHFVIQVYDQVAETDHPNVNRYPLCR